MCCDWFKDRPIRITHVSYYSFWQLLADTGNIDTTTYEGYLMQSFVEKYQLKPSFLDAGWGWGNLDKKTNLWNGMVGNVGSDGQTNRRTVGVPKFNFFFQIPAPPVSNSVFI